jgi:hypothetical protein
MICITISSFSRPGFLTIFNMHSKAILLLLVTGLCAAAPLPQIYGGAGASFDGGIDAGGDVNSDTAGDAVGAIDALAGAKGGVST